MKMSLKNESYRICRILQLQKAMKNISITTILFLELNKFRQKEVRELSKAHT